MMSYTVALRTREIGIRMALGAERGSVVWMVMRDVLRLIGIGIVAGSREPARSDEGVAV